MICEDEGADDEDGSLCPPPHAPVCGGGDPGPGLGCRAMPMELWSFEKARIFMDFQWFSMIFHGF